MDDHATIGGRVYQAIKARVTSGEFRPGERLEPPRLAKDAEASQTTTYNALRHLTIEGLLDSTGSEGFYMPMVTEAQLRGSYHWICALACLAVQNAAPAIGPLPQPAPLAVPADGDITTRTEALFDGLAALPEIDEYRGAMAQASERLRAVRRLEGYLIPDLDGELVELTDASADPERLIHLLTNYRDRRLASVPDLARIRIRGRPFPIDPA